MSQQHPIKPCEESRGHLAQSLLERPGRLVCPGITGFCFSLIEGNAHSISMLHKLVTFGEKLDLKPVSVCSLFVPYSWLSGHCVSGNRVPGACDVQ